ncbi:MAG: hypothetical protein NTZ53_00905 [Cyanobacteria bacterium]|nr:hypothetical protein [Cyanobacteriota bacterium]
MTSALASERRGLGDTPTEKHHQQTAKRINADQGPTLLAMAIEKMLQLQGWMVGLLLRLGLILMWLGGRIAIEIRKLLLQIGLGEHRLTGDGRRFGRRDCRRRGRGGRRRGGGLLHRGLGGLTGIFHVQVDHLVFPAAHGQSSSQAITVGPDADQ